MNQSITIGPLALPALLLVGIAALFLAGFAARWVERFEQGDWTDCFTFVRKRGAQALVDRVRELEHADAEARTYLGRSKTHDDATVVYAEL